MFVLNLDEFPDSYVGEALIAAADIGTSRPHFVARVRTRDKSTNVALVVEEIAPIDPTTGVPTDWRTVSPHFPSVDRFATSATLTARLAGGGLAVEWATDAGDKGSCLAERRSALTPSELAASRMNWRQFKESIGGDQWKNELFRGQQRPWRLQSAFHRRERADLARFVRDDLRQAHHHINAITNERFDRGPGDDLALLSLMQHHGYPTPLLDWTNSPYVAALFAFRGVDRRNPGEGDVRIYALDQVRWKRLTGRPTLGCPYPHLTLLDVLPGRNPRMLPQQAVSMLSTAADIEHYLAILGRRDGVTYLRAIDIPASERNAALQDLRFMGITSGSMFPGLDGVCEELRDRNFD